MTSVRFDVCRGVLAVSRRRALTDREREELERALARLEQLEQKNDTRLSLEQRLRRALGR